MPDTPVTETLDVCPLAELPAGEMRLVEVDGRKIGVFHCADGGLVAIEDRCSHDDGPLAEGEFDATACTVECPRHGSLFDLKSGRCLNSECSPLKVEVLEDLGAPGGGSDSEKSA